MKKKILVSSTMLPIMALLMKYLCGFSNYFFHGKMEDDGRFAAFRLGLLYILD